MLRLWLSGFWYTAWWPVGTWLLTMQKAAGQTPSGAGGVRPRDGRPGSAAPPESPMVEDGDKIQNCTPAAAGGDRF
jgi:hypothetical protein